MLIGQWRDNIFLNFALWRGQNYLLTIGPQVAQQQVIQSLSCFHETMASRFEIVDVEYIKELKDKSENENAKNCTECWKNVFKKWANERNLQAYLEEYENYVLDQRLSLFFKHNNNNYWYLPGKLHSPENGFQGGPASDRIGIWNCWFFRRGENRRTQRKTSRSRVKNQQPT